MLSLSNHSLIIALPVPNYNMNMRLSILSSRSFMFDHRMRFNLFAPHLDRRFESCPALLYWLCCVFATGRGSYPIGILAAYELTPTYIGLSLAVGFLFPAPLPSYSLDR